MLNLCWSFSCFRKDLVKLLIAIFDNFWEDILMQFLCCCDRLMSNYYRYLVISKTTAYEYDLNKLSYTEMVGKWRLLKCKMWAHISQSDPISVKFFNMRQLKKIYIINLHRHTVQHFKALISITIHTFKKIKYPDSFCHEWCCL